MEKTSSVIHECQTTCEGCPFRGPKVGGKGPIDSPLVVIAESPGRQEVRKGFPLAGPSGHVVHSYIPEDSAYFINAVECNPPSNKDQKKLANAVRKCRGRVYEQIGAHPRQVIIAMGAAALWSLTGDYGLKITKERGQIIKHDLAQIGIIPVLHPAALMRGTGSFRQWREDIAYALDLMQGRPITRFVTPDVLDVHDGDGGAYLFELAMCDLRSYTYYGADIETATLSNMSPEREVIDLGVEPIRDDFTPTHKVYRFAPKWIKHPDLRKLIEDRQRSWIWHNGKFDTNYLRACFGIKARVDEDTMLLSYARDETRGVHDLDTVSVDVLNAPNHKGMIEQYLPNKKASYKYIPQAVRTQYLALDVGKTSQNFCHLRSRIASDPDLEKLYTQTLLPASRMLAQVERNGMWVDQEVVRQNDKEFSEEIAESLSILQELAGYGINPNSPMQVRDYLYNKLKLPNKKRGSTAQDVLERLPQVPFVVQLLKHRRLVKVHGTYIKNLITHTNAQGKVIPGYMMHDGRVHATYLIHGTPTGRLASREPNAQNQPREPRIRGQFGAPPGRILVEIDLKQAELRVLAALSGDPVLCAIFNEGRDLHDEVARGLFGIADGETVSKEQRVMAKTVNFGIIYGRTGFTIAQEFGMSVSQADNYVQGWLEQFPLAAEFLKKCRDAPRRLQTMTTPFGRKKRPGLVTRDNIRDLQNEAANFPEQSIASDITLHTAINTIDILYHDFDALIVNLIHDALLIEMPDNEQAIDSVCEVVSCEFAEVPRRVGITEVTFESDASKGSHWGWLK